MIRKSIAYTSSALILSFLTLQGGSQLSLVGRQALLFQSIEQVIVADAVVIAWEKVLEDSREGTQNIGGMSRPELRLKVEQDSIDDDVRMGSAFRWRLDESMPKWYRAVEANSLVQIYEHRLRIAKDQIRVALKGDCLRLSFLRKKLDQALELVALQERHLKEQETLLEYKNVRALSPMKAKLALVTAVDNVDTIEADLIELEKSLIERGMVPQSLANLDFDYSWQLQTDRPWLDISSEDIDTFLSEITYDHPRLAIIALEKNLLRDQRLAKLKKSGLGLSYVQLEYEQENDSDRAINDSSVGLSFGINLPFWNNSSHRKRIAAKNETDTEFIRDSERIKDEILKSLRDWKGINGRDRRLRPQMEILISELETLEVSLETNGSSISGEQSFEIKQELIEVIAKLDELRYKVLSTALDVEDSMHQAVLFNP